MSNKKQKIRVGISIGDPNGIGLEVILKSLMDKRVLEGITPVIYASSDVVAFHQQALGLKNFQFNSIGTAKEAVASQANVKEVWDEEVQVQLGKESSRAATYAIKSFKTAVSDLASNEVDVLVTGPFHKHAVQGDDFKFPGHTEFLADYSNVDEALMMMVSEDLRVGVVSGHVPLQEVPQVVTSKKVREKITIMRQALEKDFVLPDPRIAVLGLNPHAGDRGLLGKEDKEIIAPVLEEMREEGKVVNGPFPADGFFGSEELRKYDGIMAMYHDQGLAPFKALSFDRGVNFTAGLPIVRTAPDHGTAFGIAGKGEASPVSFRNAIFLACDIYRNRVFHKEANAQPLQPQEESPYMKR